MVEVTVLNNGQLEVGPASPALILQILTVPLSTESNVMATNVELLFGCEDSNDDSSLAKGNYRCTEPMKL